MKKLLTILFFIPIVLHAQTRFYIFRGFATAVSPTVNAAWNVTTGNTFAMCFPSKSGQAVTLNNASVTSGQSGAASPRKMLLSTFISQPLIAQTISSGSTISAQFRANSSSTASGNTTQLTLYFRYCDENGTNITEIGNASSTNLTTSSTNRTISFTLPGNVTITDNQRLIIEVGFTFSAGSSTTQTGTAQQSCAITAGDLPVDNTTTSSLNPWIEFSQTLNFRYKNVFF